MKTNNSLSMAILMTAVAFLLSACGTSSPPLLVQTSAPTLEPIQTSTAVPTVTLSPVNTPPSLDAFDVILSGAEINVLNDVGWQDHSENGSAEYACANYLNPGNNVLLTNCFGREGDVDEVINFVESQGGGERLDSHNAYDQYGTYYVLGLQEPAPNRGLSFYGVLGTGGHIISTAINFPNETEPDLQKFYDETVSDLFLQVVQANLSKLNAKMGPTPGP